MPDESRKHPRASVPGVRATYERADGDAADDHARNLGKGGMFVATASPVAVGKLLHLEVHLPKDPVPIAATGRVVWTRDVATTDERPAGMGVRFVDVDEGALEVIGRIVREHATKPGATERERTILGVAPPSTPPPPMKNEAPTVGNAPARAAEIEERASSGARGAASAVEKKSGSGAGWLLLVLLVAAVLVLLFWEQIAGK